MRKLFIAGALSIAYIDALTDGSVYFYTDINFKGTLFPVDISSSKMCYSLCKFNDASSVKWLGRFPTTGKIYGKSHVAFYTEGNCIGRHIHFPIAFNHDNLVNASVKDLSQYKINDNFSSFMVWDAMEKGAHMQCA